MKDWQHQAHRRASIVFDQMRAALAMAPDDNARECFLADNPYLDILDRLYSEEFQLGRLLDTADLIFHAEGPSAKDMPQLHDFNWMCANAEKNLRGMGASVLQLATADAKKIARDIDIRLAGMAPGGLYVGFALSPPESTLLGLPQGEDDSAFAAVRGAIRSLPVVVSYIGAEHVSREIADALPDPAIRDAGITAAFHLAPTGRRGIHTIGLSASGVESASLSLRERVVLRHALQGAPMMRQRIKGSFVGEIREVDLDARRFHLRGIPNVGTLRCVWSAPVEDARHWLGRAVKVTGDYEADRSGRPRLLVVSDVAPWGGKQEDLSLPTSH